MLLAMIGLLLLALATAQVDAGVDVATEYSSALARLTAARNARQRFYALRGAAKAAIAVGKMPEAQAYATELLESASQFQDDWNYGNAVHDGHLVLGRLAFRGGDAETAKAELLAAGETPGSPQLNSFGPNMALAKDLLELGDTDTVLEYFRRCEGFWASGAERLTRWRLAIADGRVPDFGANLRY